MKKVLVRRFGHEQLEGYVYPEGYLHPKGVEVLARSARAVLVPYDEVRAVYFVREFEGDVERTHQRFFGSRPKTRGLWVSVKFKDGEEMEGVIPNDLGILGPHGVTLTPPDKKANAHLIFVPRLALDGFVVRGVIGQPFRKIRRKASGGEHQPRLFPAPREARGTAL